MIFYGNRGNFPCVEGNVKVMPLYAYAMGAERTLCPKAGDVSKWRRLKERKGLPYADAWFELQYERQLSKLGCGGILEMLSQACGAAEVAHSRTRHAFLEDAGGEDVPKCANLIAKYLGTVGIETRRMGNNHE